MNIWITKNIRFGFRYTINKTIRTQINSCLNDWLDDLLNRRAKEDDILVIYGGLFSNTNPSIIAINDAHNFLKKISYKIKVYLINSPNDIRLFDTEQYSTLDIFSDMNNVFIKNEFDLNEIFNDEKININHGIIGNMNIPNIMQLEETEETPGIIVYNCQSKKHIFIENVYSPKHVKIRITNIDDLIHLDKNIIKDNFIHVELDDELYEDKKLEINVALHNLNVCSVKYINTELSTPKDDDMIDITNSLNIVDTIYSHIGDDEEVKRQFERVLGVFKK